MVRPTFSRSILSHTPVRTFTSTPRSSLARMQIVGRLAAAPEQYTSPSGVEMIRYTVGSSYGKPGTESAGVSWFKIACFDEGAIREFLPTLPKGTLVHVDADGRMRTVGNGDDSRKELSLVQRSVEVLSRPRPGGLEEQGRSAATAGAEAGDEA